MDVVDTDVLIDVQRGHAPALAWFAALTELPSVPGFVVMELVQDSRNAQEVRRATHLPVTSHIPDPCLIREIRGCVGSPPSGGRFS